MSQNTTTEFQEVRTFMASKAVSGDVLLFTNNASGLGVVSQWRTSIPLIKPDDNWVTVEIPDNLPDETVGLYLHGILIIGNTTQVVTHQTLAFRAFGETANYVYNSQQRAGERIEETNGVANDGDRACLSVYVPVKDRKFDIKWGFIGYNLSSPNTATPIGFNLQIEGYATSV